MENHKCEFRLEIVNRPCLHFLCWRCSRFICIERDELYSATVGLNHNTITYTPLPNLPRRLQGD